MIEKSLSEKENLLEWCRKLKRINNASGSRQCDCIFRFLYKTSQVDGIYLSTCTMDLTYSQARIPKPVFWFDGLLWNSLSNHPLSRYPHFPIWFSAVECWLKSPIPKVLILIVCSSAGLMFPLQMWRIPCLYHFISGDWNGYPVAPWLQNMLPNLCYGWITARLSRKRLLSQVACILFSFWPWPSVSEYRPSASNPGSDRLGRVNVPSFRSQRDVWSPITASVKIWRCFEWPWDLQW